MSTDSPAIRAAFLVRLLQDRRAATVQSLADYQALYPGYESLIAAEFARLDAGSPEDGGDAAPAAAASSKELDEFRRRYQRDASSGGVRPLPDYVADFPDAASEIAEEYARLIEHHRAVASDAAWFHARPGERFGPYELREELGRGGQGAVFRADDTRLGRPVALKVLASRWFDTDTARRRLQREAALASRLDHPGICTVYEAGVHDGVAYVAMQWIDGRTLAQQLAGSGPPASRGELQERLDWIEQAARAAHAAHERGIVHRDLKLSNLMRNRDGRVVVLDFGLARGDDDASLTRTGDVFGTPAYLAPESIRGDSPATGAAADVYALGVCLYELLTGAPPFRAPTREALYRAILDTAAPGVRARVPGATRDLDVVLATALEKEPARRYASASEFADDLKALRESRPVAAVRPGPGTRLLRWAARDPVRAMLTAGVLLLVIAASLLGGYLAASSQRIEAGTDVLRQRELDALLVQAFGLSGGVGSLASRQLAAALEDNPGLGLVRASLVLGYHEVGREAEAVRVLDTAPEGQRSRPAFARLREALQHGVQVPAVPPALSGGADALDEFVAGWLLYNHYLRSGDGSGLPLARQHLDRAVLASPRAEPIHHVIRIQVLLAMDDHRALADAAAGLLAQWPESATTWYWVGMARKLHEGDVPGATEAMQEAVRLDPRLSRAQISRSMLLLEQGRMEESEQAFQDGVDVLAELGPDVVTRQYLLRGRALGMLGHHEAAEDWLRRALQRKPDDRDVRVALASTLVHVDAAEEAADMMWALLEEEPANVQASRALVEALEALGDELTLEEELRRRVEVAPDDGVAWLGLARLLEVTDPEECDVALVQALRQRADLTAADPGLGTALDELAGRRGLRPDDDPR